ncbi:hypothetical protein FXO38_08693 [Capsicum annuum]|nr:hypothetical protein FXO38_08693 [Capsicum annuum]
MDSKKVLIFDPCIEGDFDELYYQCRKIIWLMRIRCHDDTQVDITGFTLGKEGYIITTQHSLPKNIKEIEARPLHEDGFNYLVEVVLQKPSWNVVWLKIMEIKDNDTEIKNLNDISVGQLASDSSLSLGEVLLHIIGADGHKKFADGSDAWYVGSFSVGRVSFPCLDKVDLPKDNVCCKDYVFDYSSRMPRYRILGHLCNSQTHSNYDFGELVHPQLPLIQISDLNDCSYRTSGSPVFNDKGQVVGMMLFADANRFCFAIHASILRESLKELGTLADEDMS